MKILIVDDEQDIIEFLSYNLEKEGFEVITEWIDDPLHLILAFQNLLEMS